MLSVTWMKIDVALDLGAVFGRSHETGPYHKIVRYDRPPDPPVSGEDTEWARSVVERSR